MVYISDDDAFEDAVAALLAKPPRPVTNTHRFLVLEADPQPCELVCVFYPPPTFIDQPRSSAFSVNLHPENVYAIFGRIGYNV